MALHRHPGRLLLFATVLAIVGNGRVARAQDDDAPVDDDEPHAAAKIHNAIVAQMPNLEQVDQWVFGRFGGSGGARTRLDSSLELRLEDLSRTCGISDGQKKKLKLAGRGDIKRFFDRVEEVKRRFQAQNDPNANIWPELQPLQVEINAGLFGDNSIYAKAIRNTLSDDQAARYETVRRQRTSVRHRSAVEWFVAHVDKGLGLSDDQRRRFVALLVNDTRPPRKFGHGDYWYFMLQAASLPAAKLKAIFDAPQWRLLSRQFVQARGMEQWLKTNGVIPDDGKEPKTGAMAIDVELVPVAPGIVTRRFVRFDVAPAPPAPPAAAPKEAVRLIKKGQ
jgi:hypothetical protein